MIEAFQNINKAFESKVRLGIMAVLMVNEDADFNTLKELLSLTDGNLASHTRALEELGYIVCQKSFVGRKPKTSFRATSCLLYTSSLQTDVPPWWIDETGSTGHCPQCRTAYCPSP